MNTYLNIYITKYKYLNTYKSIHHLQ